MTAMKSDVRHVLTILAVTDLLKSAKFYEQAFGWVPDVRAPYYIEYAPKGGPRFGLYTREGFGRNTSVKAASAPPAPLTTSTEIYFFTDDPSAAGRRLREAGGRLLSPLSPRPWGDEAAYYADPDGNVLVLAKPMEKK